MARPHATLAEVLNRTRREYLLRCLERCGWNVTAAAQRAGIHRTALHDAIRRLGLRPAQSSGEQHA